MKIPVFYNDNMNVKLEFESPSPGKPQAVVNQWVKKFGKSIVVKDFLPIKPIQFLLAHSKDHVEDVLSCKKRNGLGTTHKELADSLIWTTGSLVEAAKCALGNKISVSPTSGFHHAWYNKSWKYCTFNGLIVAARILLLEGLANKVGILDCDMHYGDGTVNIIEKLGLGADIVHITADRDYPYDAKIFFDNLPYLLEKFKKCGLLIYQAGADPHIADPLGGFLDSDQLRLRDNIVFKFCKENNIPLVWNLAGGYQEEKTFNGKISIQKVLDIHNATMEECIKIYK